MLCWSRPTVFPSLLCLRKSPSSFTEGISFCLRLLKERDHCCRSLSYVCHLLGEAASQLPLPVLAKRLSCLPILLCVPFIVKLMPEEFWLCPHRHDPINVQEKSQLDLFRKSWRMRGMKAHVAFLSANWGETPDGLKTGAQGGSGSFSPKG